MRSSSWLIELAVCGEHMLVVTDIEFLRKGKTQNILKVHYIDKLWLRCVAPNKSVPNTWLNVYIQVMK